MPACMQEDDVKQILLGLCAIGWLACSVETSQPAPEPVTESATQATIQSTPEAVAAPQFNQCPAGSSCVPEDSCDATGTNVICGVGRRCCIPTGCAGTCVPFRTWCTAGNQRIDGDAVCPGRGFCCITGGIE